MGDIGIGIAMTLTVGGGGIWFLIDVFLIGKRIESINLDWKLKRQQEITLWNQKREQEIRLLSEQKLRRSGILEVDEMTGEIFEEFLQSLLKNRGYKVSLTSTTGDYGADLILLTTNKKIAVQAKRYRDKVGIKAVQEIASAKSYYDADECWVITNNYFTEPAVKLAYSNDVILINREQLIEWMVEDSRDV